MANPWMIHLKKVWQENKGKMTYGEAMKLAKKSYTPIDGPAKKKAPKKKSKKSKK